MPATGAHRGGRDPPGGPGHIESQFGGGEGDERPVAPGPRHGPAVAGGPRIVGAGGGEAEHGAGPLGGQHHVEVGVSG